LIAQRIVKSNKRTGELAYEFGGPPKWLERFDELHLTSFRYLHDKCLFSHLVAL